MKQNLLAPLLAALLVLAIVPSAFAAEMLVGNVRVIKVTGSSAQLLSAAGQKKTLKEGMFIQQGSKILTGGDSTVALVFENGASVQVEPSSQFSIDEFVQDPFKSENLDYKNVEQSPTRSVTKLSITEGEMIFDVAKQKSGSTFQITTPVGVAGIRGTSGSAGSGGFGLATGSASFAPRGGSVINFRAAQFFSPGTGMGSIPPGLQQSISAATQTLNSNTPPNTFNAAPPNITPQQHSALVAAAAQGAGTIAQVAAQLASQDPAAASDIAAAATYMLPQAAPQIAGSVAQTIPGAAVDVARSVAKTAPELASEIAQAIINRTPSADPVAVEEAVRQGAGRRQGASDEPLATGDQGTTTAGQQLPGTASGGASGNPGSVPRPTPASQ